MWFVMLVVLFNLIGFIFYPTPGIFANLGISVACLIYVYGMKYPKGIRWGIFSCPHCENVRRLTDVGMTEHIEENHHV